MRGCGHFDQCFLHLNKETTPYKPPGGRISSRRCFFQPLKENVTGRVPSPQWWRTATAAGSRGGHSVSRPCSGRGPPAGCPQCPRRRSTCSTAAGGASAYTHTNRPSQDWAAVASLLHDMFEPIRGPHDPNCPQIRARQAVACFNGSTKSTEHPCLRSNSIVVVGGPASKGRKCGSHV